jgi:hypothetical protein
MVSPNPARVIATRRLVVTMTRATRIRTRMKTFLPTPRTLWGGEVDLPCVASGVEDEDVGEDELHEGGLHDLGFFFGGGVRFGLSR